MQNRKKSLKIYKTFIKKTRIKKRLIKSIKNRFYPFFSLNKLKNNLNIITKLLLIIKVKPNNIFCTLLNDSSKNILINKSAGNYSFNISKKLLKYYHKLFLTNFFQQLKTKISRVLSIILISPLKLRKSILKLIFEKFKKIKLFIQLKPLVSFNGCRLKKKKRKKQKSLRLF
jgi:ribosomal protein S11